MDLIQPLHHLSRITDHDSADGHIAAYYGTIADNGAVSDAHTLENGCARADPDMVADGDRPRYRLDALLTQYVVTDMVIRIEQVSISQETIGADGDGAGGKDVRAIESASGPNGDPGIRRGCDERGRTAGFSCKLAVITDLNRPGTDDAEFAGDADACTELQSRAS